jgi:hypothetical protein
VTPRLAAASLRSVERIPLGRQPGLVFRVALNQVSDVHDELRAQQIELSDGDFKDAFPLTTRQVCENRERELAVICIEVLVRPWSNVTAEVMVDRMTTVGCVRTRAGSQAYGQAARDQK